MIPRIQELKQQAGIQDNPDQEGLDLFAELIVRECANYITEYYPHSRYEAFYMKKHFGVEEQEKVAPKPKCSVCGTTENVKYMGGYQPYLCDSIDCIPF